MALAKLLESLIAAVRAQEDQGGTESISEISDLDAKVAAECLTLCIAIPSIAAEGSLEPFGKTQIPHFRAWPLKPGTEERSGPLRYHFIACGNWVQAMRALALVEVAAAPPAGNASSDPTEIPTLPRGLGSSLEVGFLGS